MSISSFRIIDLLGEGSFGRVYSAVNNNETIELKKKQLVAIKVMSKKRDRTILKEIEILKLVHGGKFVSQMLCSFQDNVFVYIVLRYEEKGTLLDFMQRSVKVPMDVAASLITDVVLGLNFLHCKGIIHADLKPENVLLDANLRAHVADFGLSLKITRNPFYGKRGTPGYQSPEQLNGKAWDHRTDYFVVGLMFIELVYGVHPFGSSYIEIEKNVLAMQYRVPKMHEDAESFVCKTLCDSENRLNCISVLRHPFIAPLVQRVSNSYVAHTSLLRDDVVLHPFYDNVIFFRPLQGIPFYNVQVNNQADDNREPIQQLVMVQQEEPLVNVQVNNQADDNREPIQQLVMVQQEEPLVNVQVNNQADDNREPIQQFVMVQQEEPLVNVQVNNQADDNREPIQQLVMVQQEEPLVNVQVNNQADDNREPIQQFVMVQQEEPLVNSEVDPIILDLKRQLNDYRDANTDGCPVQKTDEYIYKIGCNVCNLPIQAAVVKRTNKYGLVDRKFNIQPFTRHLLRRHFKKQKIKQPE